jgi:hypothetical protein
MQPKDVDECVKIVKTHPVIGPRYGQAIDNLRGAWLRLLGREAMRTAVHEFDGSRGRFCFFGVSVCVTDDFVREIKTSPLVWVGPELAKRTAHGNCPVLTDRQLREANSPAGGGLNLVVWEGCFRTGYEAPSEISREVIQGFFEDHQGFFFKELVANQLESARRLEWSLRSGVLLWSPERGCYVDSVDRDPEEIVREPHLVGVPRGVEVNREIPSWVGTLFVYQPPRCGFSRSEQELLLSALAGATDEELSRKLHVSVATVKKTWLSLYGRATDRLPELIPNDSPGNPEAKRGKEKRRHLLAYLYQHPEELRPVSRKLLFLDDALLKRTVSDDPSVYGHRVKRSVG